MFFWNSLAFSTPSLPSPRTGLASPADEGEGSVLGPEQKQTFRYPGLGVCEDWPKPVTQPPLSHLCVQFQVAHRLLEEKRQQSTRQHWTLFLRLGVISLEDAWEAWAPH